MMLLIHFKNVFCLEIRLLETRNSMSLWNLINFKSSLYHMTLYSTAVSQNIHRQGHAPFSGFSRCVICAYIFRHNSKSIQDIKIILTPMDLKQYHTSSDEVL